METSRTPQNSGKREEDKRKNPCKAKAQTSTNEDTALWQPRQNKLHINVQHHLAIHRYMHVITMPRK